MPEESVYLSYCFCNGALDHHRFTNSTTVHIHNSSITRWCSVAEGHAIKERPTSQSQYVQSNQHKASTSRSLCPPNSQILESSNRRPTLNRGENPDSFCHTPLRCWLPISYNVHALTTIKHTASQSEPQSHIETTIPNQQVNQSLKTYS